jgi:putative hemolysin
MEYQSVGGQDKENFLDLNRVIGNKNPALLKVMPRFVFNYLKKVIHQDDLNEIVRNNKHLYGIDFLDACLKGFGVKIIYKGLENVSPEGRWIVASNHPLGGLDGMALMWVIGKIRKDIVFPVNDLLMNIVNLKDLFIPINKHGSNANNVRIIEDTFASDKAMLFFPAGLCSRKQKNGICDLDWKKSFIAKAKAYKRDVIPCFINGRNSDWFYNLARFRAFLGIKSNIEMLYLVDEMFRQHNKEIVITFGKPISYTIFDKKITDSAWAQKLKNHVYTLENNLNSSFITE